MPYLSITGFGNNNSLYVKNIESQSNTLDIGLYTDLIEIGGFKEYKVFRVILGHKVFKVR